MLIPVDIRVRIAKKVVPLRTINNNDSKNTDDTRGMDEEERDTTSYPDGQNTVMASVSRGQTVTFIVFFGAFIGFLVA